MDQEEDPEGQEGEEDEAPDLVRPAPDQEAGGVDRHIQKDQSQAADLLPGGLTGGPRTLLIGVEINHAGMPAAEVLPGRDHRQQAGQAQGDADHQREDGQAVLRVRRVAPSGEEAAEGQPQQDGGDAEGRSQTVDVTEGGVSGHVLHGRGNGRGRPSGPGLGDRRGPPAGAAPAHGGHG